jgi:hypothetical protein
MSKTTLRKRISLVAIAGLGAGLLSVVTAVPASANSAGVTNHVGAAGEFNVATAAAALSSAGTPTAVSSALHLATANTSTSLGLLYKDYSSTTAQSATMLANGTLGLYTVGTATTVSYVASGGTFSAAKYANSSNASTALTSSEGNVAADGKSIYFSSAATAVAALWTPGAVGTYTLSYYTTASTNTTAITSASRTSGTLSGRITVTVVAASVADAYSATYSACNLATSATTATGTDASGSSARNNGQYGYINFNLRDAYNSALSAGYPLVASATNGAIVNIGSSIGSAAGSTSVSVAAPQTSIVVAQPTANAPVTTTVTLTYNGTVVCTKSLTIRGEISRMVLTPLMTQSTGAGARTTAAALGYPSSISGGVFTLDTFDSAGNKVIPVGADGSTVVSATGFTAVSGSTDTIVSAYSIGTVATGVAATDATGLWPLSSSLGLATCAKAGSNSNVQITYQNPVSGTVVTSNKATIKCAGDPYSYTASWDKASYVQGEIATLTVQFKDVAGNNAASATTGGTAATISAPQMTITSTPGANKAADINGQVKHTFTVGTSSGVVEGSYNALVDYVTLTGNATATVQSVPYKVSTGTNAVSNADVLKSIVALIASINKQIQALQKLILKR